MRRANDAKLTTSRTAKTAADRHVLPPQLPAAPAHGAHCTSPPPRRSCGSDRWPAAPPAIMGREPHDRSPTDALRAPRRGRAAGVARLPATAERRRQAAPSAEGPAAGRAGRRRGLRRRHHVQRVPVAGEATESRGHRPPLPRPHGRAARLPAPPARRSRRASRPRGSSPPDNRDLTFHLRADARWSDGVAGHGGGRPLHVSSPRRTRASARSAWRSRTSSGTSRSSTRTPSGFTSRASTRTSSWTPTTATSSPRTPGARSRSRSGGRPTSRRSS